MKVKFLTPVQHDADHYQTFDTADLPRKDAEPLIACGAAVLLRSGRDTAHEAAETAAAEKALADKAAAEKAAAGGTE